MLHFNKKAMLLPANCAILFSLMFANDNRWQV